MIRDGGDILRLGLLESSSDKRPCRTPQSQAFIGRTDSFRDTAIMASHHSQYSA
jgi:hypothetical protein